ncbi:MAG: autotransporter-associated beta strand repeat-containing protein [Planctomycetia bacterium]|nr:autotransporter-associated beta strand repeat-containing protein [Planctomycetia bacterium]
MTHTVARSRVGLRGRIAAVLLIQALLAVAPLPAPAADNFWTGGAGNGNFSDNANWQSPPSWGFGNSLVFKANTTAPTLTNDYGGWRDNNDIFWDTTFPVARTLLATGDFGINFKLRVENKSSSTQTVTMPLSGGKDGAGGIELNPVNGSLILSGPIYNDNSVDYTVYGSDTATVTNLTLNTALGSNAPTQANVDFTVAGGRNSAVQVNASQVWSGTTTVNSGAFTTANGVTLASTAIVVGGGTVATTSANTLADTASLTVNTGRLSIGGSDTVASLAGSGGTIDIASGATLTAGNASSTSYAGSITGAGNLAKVGSGTFTLSAASSMTGTTTVSTGQFSLGGSNLLADSSAVTVAGGVLALGGNSDTVGSFAISGGSLTGSGTVTAANYTLGGGTVTANLGSGTMIVTGNASLNGTSNGTTLNLTSGTLTLGSAGRLAATTAVAVTGSAGGALTLGGSETIGSLAGAANVALGSSALTVGGNNQSTTYSGGLSGSGLFTKVGSGTLTLSGINSNSGGTTVSAGRLVGTTSSLQGAITNNAAVTFDQATSGTYSGAMTGSGSLTKIGDGVVTLSGNNSTSGGVAINAGSLALGSVNALGTTGTISFGGGALQYSASNTTDYSGRFSTEANQQYRIDTNGRSVTLGSNLTSFGGSLAKLGGGALTLSGSNSFSGGIAIDAGTLALTSAGALGSTGTISFGGGTLQYVSNNATDYSDRFSTAAGQQYRIDTGEHSVFVASNLTSAGGSLTKLGSGFLNLTGTNTYSGGTVVSGGTLIGTPDSLQGAITNNAQVTFVNGGIYAGVISGSGAVEVQSTLRFTAANTYTGETIVSSGGGLRLDGSIAGDLLVDAVSSLSGTGTVGGNAVIGGVHSPGNSPGIQTFNGNLTYRGDENVPQVNWELIANTTGSAGVNYDQVVMPTGNLDFANATTLALSFDALGSSVLWSDAFWNVNRSWTIYDLTTGTTNNIGNLSVGGSLLDSLGNALSPTGRGFFTTSLVGQDVVLNFTAVPEPSTWAMALAGFAGGGWMMRRRKPAGGPRPSALS